MHASKFYAMSSLQEAGFDLNAVSRGFTVLMHVLRRDDYDCASKLRGRSGHQRNGFFWVDTADPCCLVGKLLDSAVSA